MCGARLRRCVSSPALGAPLDLQCRHVLGTCRTEHLQHARHVWISTSSTCVGPGTFDACGAQRFRRPRNTGAFCWPQILPNRRCKHKRAQHSRRSRNAALRTTTPATKSVPAVEVQSTSGGAACWYRSEYAPAVLCNRRPFHLAAAHRGLPHCTAQCGELSFASPLYEHTSAHARVRVNTTRIHNTYVALSTLPRNKAVEQSPNTHTPHQTHVRRTRSVSISFSEFFFVSLISF